jgi:predicted RNA methylase
VDKNQVRLQRDELVKGYGPWTAHCIHLADNVYTFDHPQIESRLRRYLQIAADIVVEPLDRIRVLDLACLEGQFGVEFALHGANVVGIEGREVNVARAQFAKDTLSLDNLRRVQDDVRHLSRERYGKFDVILCLGILYHLDAPDVMEFMENIFETCTRVAIIDTHFSLEDRDSYVWKGNTYWGVYVEEHNSQATERQKLDALWHSIGNLRSFKLTRPSICNLLRHVGFTSVYECLNPYEYWPLPASDNRHVVWKDRTTFVAIKGRNQNLKSSPITEASPEINRPEKPKYYVWQEGDAPGRAKPGWARKLLRLLAATGQRRGR